MLARDIFETNGFDSMRNDKRIADSLGLPLIKYKSRRDTLVEYLDTVNWEFDEDSYLDWLIQLNSNDHLAEVPEGCADNIPSTLDQMEEGRHKKPSTKTMAKNFAKEFTEHIKNKAKSVSKEIAKERMDKCISCKYLGTTGKWKNRCKICGCVMKIKTKWETSQCPIEKW